MSEVILAEQPGMVYGGGFTKLYPRHRGVLLRAFEFVEEDDERGESFDLLFLGVDHFELGTGFGEGLRSLIAQEDPPSGLTRYVLTMDDRTDFLLAERLLWGSVRVEHWEDSPLLPSDNDEVADVVGEGGPGGSVEP